MPAKKKSTSKTLVAKSKATHHTEKRGESASIDLFLLLTRWYAFMAVVETARETYSNSPFQLLDVEMKNEEVDDDDDSAMDEEAMVQSSVAKKSPKQKGKKPNVAKDDSASTSSSNFSRSNVIYIGHLPAVLKEAELVKFLKQFGGVTHVRVSRSEKTGGSRGYAFCRMENAEIAAIVADTLSGYLLFDAKQHVRKRLVCHVVPPEKVHPRLFIRDNSAASVIEARRKRLHAKPPATAMEQTTSNLIKRERKKRAQLQALGIDYTDFPGYEAGLSSTTNKTAIDDDSIPAASKKKRKESIDATSEASNKSTKKKAKKQRKESVDSVASTESNSPSRKLKSEKKTGKPTDKSDFTKKTKGPRQSLEIAPGSSSKDSLEKAPGSSSKDSLKNKRKESIDEKSSSKSTADSNKKMKSDNGSETLATKKSHNRKSMDANATAAATSVPTPKSKPEESNAAGTNDQRVKDVPMEKPKAIQSTPATKPMQKESKIKHQVQSDKKSRSKKSDKGRRSV